MSRALTLADAESDVDNAAVARLAEALAAKPHSQFVAGMSATAGGAPLLAAG